MFRQNTILILGFIFILYGCKKEPSNESPNVQANWTFINDQNSLLGNNVVGLEISIINILSSLFSPTLSGDLRVATRFLNPFMSIQ